MEYFDNYSSKTGGGKLSLSPYPPYRGKRKLRFRHVGSLRSLCVSRGFKHKETPYDPNAASESGVPCRAKLRYATQGSTRHARLARSRWDTQTMYCRPCRQSFVFIEGEPSNSPLTHKHTHTSQRFKAVLLRNVIYYAPTASGNATLNYTYWDSVPNPA